jgi:hypothetical protein
MFRRFALPAVAASAPHASRGASSQTGVGSLFRKGKEAKREGLMEHRYTRKLSNRTNRDNIQDAAVEAERKVLGKKGGAPGGRS